MRLRQSERGARGGAKRPPAEKVEAEEALAVAAEE